MNRRHFIGISTLSALCDADSVHLKTDDAKIVHLLIGDLFPDSKEYPSQEMLNSVNHIFLAANDHHFTRSYQTYILQGIQWLDESAKERYKLSYAYLTYTKRQLILKQIAALQWGDEWLSTIMSLYFESMYCDPIYNVNLHQSGWHWLDYTPGYPRPSKRLL